jgi:serine/threonine protein kinase
MTNTNTNTNKGGNVIASGGYGCVFSPALRCEGETKRHANKISKLMTEKHAISEYEEIVSIKEKLQSIKDYKNYFLIYDAVLCKPANLSNKDLTDYTNKCTALPKDKITKNNINDNLDKLLSLNIPNGGLPVDDYLYNKGSIEKMYRVHQSLMKLYKKGIIPMNNRDVYHCDIKDSNVLVDTDVKTRLIDWGLAVEYTPFKDHPFPSSWKNRPFQFNVPFSVVLFSDSFLEKYTAFLENGVFENKDKPNKFELKPFVINYISSWMKERGAGHYKFMNEIMFELFSHSITYLSDDSKHQIIETQITMNYIINYLVDVLVHFTKFGTNVKLNLRDYLDNVFIKIVDIWGFISVYFSFVEILFNNYSKLTTQEMKIFNKLQYIFGEYLYNPRHEPIDVNSLYSELKELDDLFRIKSIGKNQKSKKMTRFAKSSTMEEGARGLKKTRRNFNSSKTSISFKRQQNQRRFKKPFLLSLK